MSCDHNRARLFRTLAPRMAALVGSPAAGQELLEMVYDVAVNQTPPEDKAAQLAAAAAFQKMKARASQGRVALYPHKGLPAPEAQAAWAQVSALLDAVEGGKPLPPLAADVQQITAFRGLAANPTSAWNMSAGSTMRLRQLWADDPERVRLLVASPEALGGAEHAAHLAEMTRVLADDPKAPPHLTAAARYAQALDNEGVLDGAERVAWAQILGAAAGVGVGPERCPTCGVAHADQKPCEPEDVAYLGAVAGAVAEVLADPDHAQTAPDLSPYGAMEGLLHGWMQTRRGLQAGSAMARLLAVAQVRDAAWVERMASQLGDTPAWSNFSDPERLHHATLRRPVIFDDTPHVWDSGYLIPLDRWIAQKARASQPDRAAQHWSWGYANRNPLEEIRTAEIQANPMVRMMAGRNVPATSLTFAVSDRGARFQQVEVPVATVRRDQYVALPCGCIYHCTGDLRKSQRGTLERHSSGGCSDSEHYGRKEVSFGAGSRLVVRVPDLEQPTFAMPTWPAPVAASAPEAPNVL